MRYVEIGRRPDDTGLELVDPFSGEQYAIATPSAVEIAETDVAFPVPVSDTVEFQTDALTIETSVLTYVRHPDGTMDGTLRFGTEAIRGPGRWLLELSTPVKTYLLVDGPFSIDITSRAVRIQFQDTQPVALGARSYTRYPEHTVTTSAAPADIAAAISVTSTAIETYSPERSFPTLRNHPPSITLGSELEIPDDLERPDTGVTLETPFELEYLYAMAPLSFYLGADLVERHRPALVLKTGTSVSLASPTVPAACRRLLQRLVFLDCLTRTEGLYPIELAERTRLDESIDLPWESLYEASLAERTGAYLEVEFDALEPHLPRWPARGYVQPTPASVEILPHLLDQLLPIQPTQPDRLPGSDARKRALSRFLELGAGQTRTGESAFDTDRTFVELPTGPEYATLWYGRSVPIGANHLLHDGVTRYNTIRPKEQSEITVTVVCNDPTMATELDTADAIYGSRETVPFAVETYSQLRTDRLAALFAEPRDFVHFIGHASEAGLHCPDGVLRPASLDSVAVRTFFLNACSSYTPGVELIERGAIGGVATLSDVNESSATDVGVMVAGLLNNGFSLRTALFIGRQQSIVGGQYLCLGMDSVSLTHTEGGIVYSCELESEAKADRWTLRVVTYPVRHWDIGSAATFQVDQANRYILAGNTLESESLSSNVVSEFLAAEDVPVRFEGEWHWSAALCETL